MLAFNMCDAICIPGITTVIFSKVHQDDLYKNKQIYANFVFYSTHVAVICYEVMKLQC